MKHSYFFVSALSLLAVSGCDEDKPEDHVEVAAATDANTEMPSKDGGSSDASRPIDAIAKPAEDAEVAAPTDASTERPGKDGGGPEASKPVDAGQSSLPECTTPPTTNCISAEGVRNGRAFKCVDAPFAVELASGTPRWQVACADRPGNVAVLVEIPVQAEGPIDLTGTPSKVNFNFFLSPYSAFARGGVGSMTESSSNLKSGKLIGSVGPGNLLSGTFTASWDKPEADCLSGDELQDDLCAEGTVKMIFSVRPL